MMLTKLTCFNLGEMCFFPVEPAPKGFYPPSLKTLLIVRSGNYQEMLQLAMMIIKSVRNETKSKVIIKAL